MKLTAPFFRQKNTDASAPACANMLSVLQRKGVPESTTARALMLRAARREGYTCRMSSSATWNDVRGCLRQGMPVFIRYREPGETDGRYALITGTRAMQVMLHDPWTGMQFTLGLKELLQRWHGYRTQEKHRGWMMTIMPRVGTAPRVLRGAHIKTFV